jgi:hypothetical protein
MAARKTNVSLGNDGTKQSKAKRQESFDADSYWKELIDRFFWLLLQITLPDLYAAADTSRKPKPLSNEFTDILNTGDKKIHKYPHRADFVIEVPLKNSASEWIILHIESQGQGSDINFRMSHYRSAIFFHYKKEPVALAIITDKRPPNESRTLFAQSFWHGERLPL